MCIRLEPGRGPVGPVKPDHVITLIFYPHAADKTATSGGFQGSYVKYIAPDLTQEFPAYELKLIMIAVKVSSVHNYGLGEATRYKVHREKVRESVERSLQQT